MKFCPLGSMALENGTSCSKALGRFFGTWYFQWVPELSALSSNVSGPSILFVDSSPFAKMIDQMLGFTCSCSVRGKGNCDTKDLCT